MRSCQCEELGVGTASSPSKEVAVRKSIRRVTVLAAVTTATVAMSTGAANADAIAIVANRAQATYDSQGNDFSVLDTNCNGKRAYGNWQWTGFNNRIKSLADPIECDDSRKTRSLSPPARATGIRIRVCQDDSGPNTCSGWTRTRK